MSPRQSGPLLAYLSYTSEGMRAGILSSTLLSAIRHLLHYQENSIMAPKWQLSLKTLESFDELVKRQIASAFVVIPEITCRASTCANGNKREMGESNNLNAFSIDQVKQFNRSRTGFLPARLPARNRCFFADVQISSKDRLTATIPQP